VWEGQFKVGTQDVKQGVGNSGTLHETKLQKFNTNLLHKLILLSINSLTCFGLIYWPISEAEHVRELINNEKV